MLNQLIKLIFPVFVLAIVIPGCTSPLHKAIQQGDDALVSLLLARGADINTRYRGDMPLHVAVQKGHYKIVQLLIAKGADVNVRDGRWGWTPLQLAVRFGHDEQEIVKLLVARGAYVDARTPYVPYQASSGRASLVEFQGLPYWNAWWETPLHIAASLGRREVAEVLLANGADVNARDSYFSTPLHRAALFGHNDVVELLIMWDADVNARDEDGQTPLDRAAEETVDLLRNHGAKNRFESRGTRD